MLKTSWMDSITNKRSTGKNIRRKANVCKNTVRWNKWIGHVIIRHGGLLKLIVEGKHHRGTPKLEYIRQLIKRPRDKCGLIYTNNRKRMEDSCKPIFKKNIVQHYNVLLTIR